MVAISCTPSTGCDAAMPETSRTPAGQYAYDGLNDAPLALPLPLPLPLAPLPPLSHTHCPYAQLAVRQYSGSWQAPMSSLPPDMQRQELLSLSSTLSDEFVLLLLAPKP